MSAYAACVIADFEAHLNYYTGIAEAGQLPDARHCETLRQRVQAQLAETSMHPIGV